MLRRFMAAMVGLLLTSLALADITGGVSPPGGSSGGGGSGVSSVSIGGAGGIFSVSGSPCASGACVFGDSVAGALGGVPYFSSSSVLTYLAGNTSATKNFLCETGTGSAAQAPSLCTLASGDVPANAANTSGTAAGLSGVPVVHTSTLTSVPAAAATSDAGNVGFVGLQSGVPFILANTCTVSTTGALSGCTALTQTYNGNGATIPSALMYFPASTVNTTASTIGSVAGFYWVIMSSTSAGQACIDNATTTAAAYVSGSPVAPAQCTHPTNASNAAFSTGIAEIAGPTFTLPANTLGANGEIIFDLMVQAETASAAAHTTKCYLAGVQVGASLAPTTAGTSQLYIRTRNTGYAQSQFSLSTGPISATSSTLQTTASNINTTVNTTTSQTVACKMTLATATATNMVISPYSIKINPN